MNTKTMPIRDRPAAHALAAVLALTSRITREATPARDGFAQVDGSDLIALGVALERYRAAISGPSDPDDEEGHE